MVSVPLYDGTEKELTSPSKTIPDGATISRNRLLLAMFDSLIYCAHHKERLFRNLVMFTFYYLSEAFYSIFNFHVSSGGSGKNFGYEHWLSQKSLNFSCTRNYQLIFI